MKHVNHVRRIMGRLWSYQVEQLVKIARLLIIELLALVVVGFSTN